MRDHLVFYLNGQRVEVAGPQAFATLADYLRDTRRLVGTKVVCAEGDCGACSVLVGRASGDGASLCYQTIDSCIAFLYQLDRAHVVTVEGLKNAGELSPVQDAMVRCHGSQCGFCTPGFVVTMHGLLEERGCNACHAEPGAAPLARPQTESCGEFCGEPGAAASATTTTVPTTTTNTTTNNTNNTNTTTAPTTNGCASNRSAERESPDAPLGEDELRLGLSGNLCRCTGYQQILDAGKAIDPAAVALMNDRYPAPPMLDDFTSLGGAAADLEAVVGGQSRRVFLPRTLEQAVAFRAKHPGCTLASGTTDLGVQHNHAQAASRPVPETLLCLTHIPSLSRVAVEDGTLVAGAAATWTQIQRFVEHLVPEYHRVLTLFGSPQVRNAATIAGNLANASPIADSIPFHLVMDATLDLVSPRGPRTVKLNDFYLGYKKIDLAEDELIAAVRTPLPTARQKLKLYKVSKRRDMDISTFTAAVLLTLDKSSQTIASARLAYGGVGPTVLRLPKAEASLAGQPLTEATMRRAGQIARSEITPLSDVRGSADFRLQLAENILVKCYHDLAPQPQPA